MWKTQTIIWLMDFISWSQSVTVSSVTITSCIISPKKHLSNFHSHGSFRKWVINIIMVFVSERHRRLTVNGAAWPLTLCVCVRVATCNTTRHLLKWSMLTGTLTHTHTHRIKGTDCFLGRQIQAIPCLAQVLDYFPNFKRSSVFLEADLRGKSSFLAN